MNKVVSWGTFSPKFIEELVTWIDGRKVLEVFSGNGLLAKHLSEKGVNIKATSLFTSHDGHQFGMQHEVENLDALSAVKKYGQDYDVLLMSWPIVSEASTKAALTWGVEKPMVFIGEVTDVKINQLGGCATDLFFDITNEGKKFKSYNPRNIIESAAVRYVDPEMALKLNPDLIGDYGFNLNSLF